MYTMKQHIKKNNAFSLIELVVVITILGILASILLFNIGGIFENSYETSIRSDLNSLAELMEVKALDEAQEREGGVRFYKWNHDSDDGTTPEAAFCTCSVAAGAGCALDVASTGKQTSIPEVVQVQEKYNADGIDFRCKTNIAPAVYSKTAPITSEPARWAAALVVPDNGALGDLGQNSTLNNSGTNDTVIAHRIYCISNTNALPVVWVTDKSGADLTDAELDKLLNIDGEIPCSPVVTSGNTGAFPEQDYQNL